jgi:hypothetical protein
MTSDEAPTVMVRSATSPAATVRLGDLQPFFDEKTFTVQVQADGLTARIDRVTVTPWDQPQLDDYFAQLAAHFSGWDGTRTWRSNHLVIDAQFGSGGHVELTWTLQANWLTGDRWQVRITTVIEAGEQMTNLTADVREFLRTEFEH